MRTFKQLATFLALTFVTLRGTSAAPIAEERAINFVRDSVSNSELSVNEPPAKSLRRSLSNLLKPPLSAVQPVTNGVGDSLQETGVKLGKTFYQLGAASQSLVHGLGEISSHALTGLGHTVKALPVAAYHAGKALDKGLIGAALEPIVA
ncbi:hypothetical protein B0H34DRAFT_718966 [Crassisporium funariophilum]|nr:hypothetical protein B0H34DRAFT_718966 [Crassisporium funariophilum]